MAPETVEPQAIEYAAYCSRFTPETLGEEYRGWRACNGETIETGTVLGHVGFQPGAR